MTLGLLPVHFTTADGAKTLHGIELGDGELLIALASALSLPDYFGGNWDALDECLRDVEEPLTLLVRDAGSRWEADPEGMRMLVDVWLTAAAERDGDLQLVFIW